MYPMETFFCYVSNCLRAHIHVVLCWVKWQVKVLVYRFVCSSYNTPDQIAFQQAINNYYPRSIISQARNGYTGVPKQSYE
jgi:hypothetical protein